MILPSHFLLYCFEECFVFQTSQPVSKYKTLPSHYLSSLVPFREVFGFQSSRTISPIISICHVIHLILYTKQEMDDELGILLSSDSSFFPLHKPANLPATQTTPNSPTNQVNSVCPNLSNHSNTTLLKPDQSLPGQTPVPSVNKFPRPPTPIFSYPSSRITFHTNKLKHAVSKITLSN